MFRKFANRFNEAVSNMSSSSSSSTSSSATSPVDTLVGMGFTREQAQFALNANQNNVDMAANFLLSNQGTSATNNLSANNHNINDNYTPRFRQEQEEDELQRALAASLEQQSISSKPKLKPKPVVRSAASKKAGQAALARLETPINMKKPSNTIQNHHPNVVVPPKLTDKSLEEQILRCTKRMEAYPNAVDRLHMGFAALQKDPTNRKYYTLNTSTVGFQTHVEPAPGALDLLRAVGFTKRHQSLELQHFDPATFYLAASALEQVQQTSNTYKQAKAQINLNAEIEKMLQLGDSSEQEAIARANCMSKCPSEPPTGTLLQVHLGTTGQIVKRRFDGDDTLLDVLNWLGGYASQFPAKLLTGEFGLIDRNRQSASQGNGLDCQALQHKTLQYIGCWPSGQLQIVPALDGESANSSSNKTASSRGLGSAPSEAL